jgi:TetR/AcrR family transcriptional regulator
MGEERDLSRSRERIFDAALQEFSERGFAGARTGAIARRASINEQMIFHCFGSKEGLYREVLHREMARISTLLESRESADFASNLAFGYEAICSNPAQLSQLRMWQWEALEGKSSDLMAERERRAFLQAEAAQLRRAKLRGELPQDLSEELILMASIGLRVVPVILPQLARLITGLSEDNPRFRRRWSKFLKTLGERIATSGSSANERKKRSVGSSTATRVLPARDKTRSKAYGNQGLLRHQVVDVRSR